MLVTSESGKKRIVVREIGSGFSPANADPLKNVHRFHLAEAASEGCPPRPSGIIPFRRRQFCAMMTTAFQNARLRAQDL
jgi:hypothetical protein